MATIITVHGTNATGPEDGTRWWQKGGPLDTHLRELLASEAGELTLKPLIWDGANSETSRRAAAEKLLQVMEGLEAAGEPYCVIAHSHGGSVAANALLLAASKQKSLPGLARCITVGTPFIKFTKSRWLFGRSRLLEKAALVAVAAFTFFFLTFIVFAGGAFRSFSPMALFGYALLIGPFLALYTALRLANAKRFLIHHPAVLQFLERSFAARMLSLRHESDEAINALRSVRRLRIPFFGRDFALPALSLLSLLIVPVSVLFLAQSKTFMTAVARSPFALTEMKSNWFDNTSQVIVNVALTLGDGSLRWLQSHGMDLPSFINTIGYSLVLAAVVGPIVLALVSLPVTKFAVATARFISAGLSRILNPLTWAQIRKGAYGNDVLGELSPDAGHSAPWSPAGSAVLPAELAQEITALSNASASDAVEKFRAGMNRLLLSDEKDAKEFFFTEYISWDELIHTRYFDSPRFRALLAHAIAQMPGFRARSALRDDPQYALIPRWYGDVSDARVAGTMARV